MESGTLQAVDAIQVDSASLPPTDRVVGLVNMMADGRIEKLVPEYSIASPVAYTYPEAADILNAEPGEEIAVLNALAERGILETEPVTTVPVCPFCRTYPLRVERTCGSCGSTAVRKTTMIHHFRCSNVSAAETYEREDQLVCPKCDQVLRHIGVDYERPSSVWLCDDCGGVMDVPQMRYHSLVCDRRVPIDDVVDRQVFAYRLSSEGSYLLSEGSLRAAIERPDAVDALTGLPGAGSVSRALELERLRATRYGTQYSAIQITIANGADIFHRYGEEVIARIIKTLATVARENLRTVDTVGRDGHLTLTAILPETDADGAAIALKKLTQSTEAYLHATGRDEAHRSAVLEGTIIHVSERAEAQSA